MSLSEFAKQLADNPAPGTFVDGKGLVQKARTLDDMAAIARVIPGEDGLPIVSNTIKRPFKTWQQLQDRIASFTDPIYRRIFDRYGAPVPREALENGTFQVVRRSPGLDASPPVTSIVDNTNKPVMKEPPIKSWVDPSVIDKKYISNAEGKIVARENWQEELKAAKKKYTEDLRTELKKGAGADPNEVESLRATIDQIDNHIYHPDVINDKRALKHIQKTELPATHVGESPEVVEATQKFVDDTVEMQNTADHYQKLQAQQDYIQQALEDSTKYTMSLPDIGRRDFPLADSIVKETHIVDTGGQPVVHNVDF
jgi:hypothetical protein